MSAARLFRLADKVVMTAITAALIVAVPVSTWLAASYFTAKKKKLI